MAGTGASPAPSDDARTDNASSAESGQYAQWLRLVEDIRAGKNQGMEELYRIFSRGVRFYLCRQLGPQELDDKVHDTFLIVVQAIRRGDLREPERLMGFVRTIVRRQVAAHIDQAVQARREQVDLESGARVVDLRANPEDDAIHREKIGLMNEVLNGISPRDREILIRFYIMEQTQEEICRAMGLTETQFRLLKSRAKARFGDLGKKKLLRRPLLRLFGRE
jgi:RNA polymerase sigma-70 factor (ECF subfamily)